MIVADASVLVKLFVPEDDSARARALLSEEHGLQAPALAKIEVAAALVRRAREQGLPAQELESRLAALGDAERSRVILFHADSDEIRPAALIAVRLGHPLQDCIYLALAERLGADLVTADRVFFDKAQRQFKRVRLLGT